MTYWLIPRPCARQGVRWGRALSALACAVLAMHGAHADDGKAGREREALRRTQQSLRQTQQERDALAGEKASLAQAKDQLSDELKQTAAKVKGAQAREASARVRQDQLEASLRSKDEALLAAQTREAALQSDLAQLQASLADKTRTLASVTSLLGTATLERQTLQSQNQALYNTGLQLVDLYRSQSPSAWLKGKDALLGFHGVQVENLAEAFRTRLDEARYNALTSGATASAATAAGPATPHKE